MYLRFFFSKSHLYKETTIQYTQKVIKETELFMK